MKYKLYFFILILNIISVSGQIYNTTPLDNSDNLYEFTYNLNNILDNFIGYGFLAVSFFIPFAVVNFTYRDAVAGLGAGSFLCLISASIMLPLELIPFNAYKIVLLITAISIPAAILTK